MMASLFQTMKYSKDEVNETFLRHLILNTYRFYRSKFYNKYGELVICHDSTNYWRKDDFPQYKANRKKALDKTGLDWTSIFSSMDKIRTEIQEVFPYKNIRIERLEADDVIASLCKEYHDKERILIISNDKDFQQLQKYSNVEQYSPTKKTMLTCDDPQEFLLTHIIKGDSSDGIPNIFSDSDTFVTEGKRQIPCGAKKFKNVVDNLGEWEQSDNWKRNQLLIDLDYLPENYRQQVIKMYNELNTGDRSKLLNYFINNKLKNLLESIEEF